MRAPNQDSRAVCRNADSTLFISAGDADDEPTYPSPDAQAYCDGCPIRPECLDWAMLYEEVGVWGGMSTYQRRQLARERARQRCVSCASTDVVRRQLAIGAVETCLACGVSWYTD